jgi:hypothetical protein
LLGSCFKQPLHDLGPAPAVILFSAVRYWNESAAKVRPDSGQAEVVGLKDGIAVAALDEILQDTDHKGQSKATPGMIRVRSDPVHVPGAGKLVGHRSA